MRGAAVDRPRVNLLFIVSSLCVGGAEMHALTLAARLDPARYRVSLAYLKDEAPLLARLAHPSLDSEVFCCGVGRKLDMAAVAMLAAHIRRRGIDIVVCANAYSLLYGWLARLRSGCRPRMVEVFHTTQLDTFKDHLQMMVYRPLIGISDMLVYVSENQRRFWRTRYLRARRDATIRNGIDTAWFADRYSAEDKARLRREWGMEGKSYLVGLCAAMRPEKAHGDLLEALVRVRAAGVDAGVVFIGDGPERRRIEARIQALGLAPHVRITGYMADVRPALAACDAIALVSHAVEAFSIAALEAMALGKPLIMSRVGGADEQVEHGVQGYLFPPRDIDQLAGHILALAHSGNGTDMGRRARARVEDSFTVERMLASYHALFDGLAGAGR